MKRLREKLWVKCTAVALLFVFAALLAASLLGIAVLASGEAYLDGGETLRANARERLLAETFATDSLNIYNAYRYNDEPALRLLLDRYAMRNSNVYFELTDTDTGAVLLSNGDDHSAHYNFSYSAYYSVDYCDLAAPNPAVTFHAYLREPMPIRDGIYTGLQWVDCLIAARGWLIVLAVFFFGADLACFIFLLCAVGHKQGVDGIYLGWLHRIPLDLFAALLMAAVGVGFTLLQACFSGDLGDLLCAVWLAICALIFVLSFAARAKQPGLFKNTLIWRVCRWCGMGLMRLPLVWRTMLIWCGWCVVDFLILMETDSLNGAGGGWWIVSHVLLTLAICYLAASLRHLQRTGQAIADGDSSDRGEPLPRWLPALRKHEQNLKSIQAGIEKAVDEQTRAERMKAELITNVSHDIKTPLTSIINYVDLLEKQRIEPEQAREYVAVLSRQSARLKKLTEDLVEASKASSGALPVHLSQTDINVLLSQLIGEYTDRLALAGVELVFKPAPSQPVIQADGKLLSRVLENLLSNVCKYALPGTRAYLESAAAEQVVTITCKNISKFELDIPADELMARFVRGDRSRHSEGSGLGLSIAKSLTELQGGQFQLQIDGDLFKAQLRFARDGSGEPLVLQKN